jgi:predicted DNA-binding transcriptional regulator AlpA
MKKFVRIQEAIKLRPESRSVFYEAVRSGLLPQPIRLGERQSCFLEDEIEQSIELDVAASRATSAESLVAWLFAYADAQTAEHGPDAVQPWFWNRAIHWAERRGWDGVAESVSARNVHKMAS